MKVTIHQPEHLVWLGLIDKIHQSDLYIVLDSVQFRKNYFQNRNKIRTANGWAWATVPVEQHELATSICDIKIANHLSWQKKYLGGIMEAYRKTKYFDEYFPMVSDIINTPYLTISELNIELLKFLCDAFGVKTPFVYSSQMKAATSGAVSSDLILLLCQEVGATEYLSGPFGRDYLHTDAFEKDNIKLSFHSFAHPTYTQVFEPFIPGMSSIDLLFNHGKDGSRHVLFPNI